MFEGFYYVLYFQAATTTLDEVTRVLKINDDVVRAMPVRLDEDVQAVATAGAAAPAEE